LRLTHLRPRWRLIIPSRSRSRCQAYARIVAYKEGYSLLWLAGQYSFPGRRPPIVMWVSIDPLVVDSDFQSLAGGYAGVEDFYLLNHMAIPPDEATSYLIVEGEEETPQRLPEQSLGKPRFRETGAVLEKALHSNPGWSVAC